MASRPRLDEVRRILRPLEGEIVDYLLEAWEQWWNNPDRTKLQYRRSRACIVHNFTMNAAILGFTGRDNVYVIEKTEYETAFFVIDQRLIFRIKKGDTKGLTRNKATQASLAFTDPDEDISLFADLPDVWRIDIAYVLNYLQTKISDVFVVARDDKSILWSYAIYGDAAEQGDSPPPPITLPVGPRTPPSAASGLRVVGGSEKEKKNKQDKKG